MEPLENSVNVPTCDADWHKPRKFTTSTVFIVDKVDISEAVANTVIIRLEEIIQTDEQKLVRARVMLELATIFHSLADWDDCCMGCSLTPELADAHSHSNKYTGKCLIPFRDLVSAIEHAINANREKQTVFRKHALSLHMRALNCRRP
jgi:hypothetical protein